MEFKPTALQKLNSFILPVKILKTSSSFNPVLEITLENGRLVLNAAHANYSYGSLLDVFLQAFEHFRISFARKKILMLGMGAGSVAKHIAMKNSTVQIDAVEIDKVVIDLSINYFNLNRFPSIHIIHDDAFSYVEKCSQTYNLILVDLFIDNEPPDFSSKENFIKKLIELVSPKGEILINQSMNMHNNPSAATIKDRVEKFQTKILSANQFAYLQKY